MRLTGTLVAAFAATAFAAPNIQGADNRVVKGAYIVQFEAGQDSTDTFFQNLTNNGIEVAPRQKFQQPGIFSGASFRLMKDDKTFVDTIGNFTQVKTISPVRIFHRVAPVANPWKNVDFTKLGKSSLNKRVITPGADTITTHIMTGVDKLHKEGLDGKGIRIAEIDSGIDYKLAALGGGFGPGFKVAFGYDLVGDDYNGENTPVPDSDPMDCNGHGTHVAGIIGAENDPYVLGVAPKATLGIYKVFGCEGGSANDILIASFLMAHNAGVDLITASIGGASGWPEEPWAAATAGIIAAGTPCLLAAGNDGALGMYYASSASAGTDVTSVGSVDNTNSPEVLNEGQYVINGVSKTFGYTPAVGSFASVSLPLYANSFDTNVANDGCTAYTADLTGKIALIRRGGCTFLVKANNAVAAGAKYVMFYNNAPGTIQASVEGSTVTAAGMVDPQTGAIFVNALSSGETITLTFPETPELQIVSPGDVNTASGGYMSIFSTWNPSNENTIKPVVSAPGGNILSTYPSKEGGYAVLSGTSMATPFIAGVVALYKQSKGKNVSPQTINAALSGTGKPLKFNSGTATSPYLTSVAQQGGGLVDAYHMIHAGIAVTEANLAFNDTANHVRNAAFYVQNTGTTTLTYTLTHSPSANYYAFTPDKSYIAASFPPPSDTKYAAVSITPSTLTIKPGEKKRVTVSATPDASLDANLVPFYSGFINITSGSETIHIPYGGAATTMHDIGILQDSFGWPLFDAELATSNGTDGKTSSFKPSVGSTPIFLWNNKWATAAMRLDIISVGGANPVFAAGVNTAGSVTGFPLQWVARSATLGEYMGAAWDGSFADGTVAKSGTYKFSLRLAKVYADLSRGREYERYDSQTFSMDMS